MLSRLASARHSGPLAVLVFLIGVAIGGVIIALSHHTSTKRLVVKQVTTATAATKVARPATTSHAAARAVHSSGASPLSVVPAGADASFAAFQAQLGGQVGLAVAPLGSGAIHTFGSLQTGHAWSTMKVPVLATLLHDYEQDGQVLSPQGHTDAALALEQSDNAAAEALFGVLEQIHGGLDSASAAVQQTLGNAGDQSTTINTAPNNQGFTTWGQSEWSTSGEILFYRSLADGCLLGPHDTAYVLNLLRNVTGSQRWGAGAAGYPTTVPLAFKAGWGPEGGGGYLVRQTAIIGAGSQGYVLSMLALPSSGSFAEGVSMVTALASWARQHLALNATTSPAQCASRP
jgi:hypothetical protein